MKHHLCVELTNQAVAVERFLRVARHRGFRLTSMDLSVAGDLFQLNISVDSDKPIYLLTQQLSKLVDVRQVNLHHYQQQAV